MKISIMSVTVCLLSFAVVGCSSQPKQNHQTNVSNIQRKLNQVGEGDFGQLLTEMENSNQQIRKAKELQNTLRTGDFSDGQQQMVEANGAVNQAISHRNNAEKSLQKILEPMRKDIKHNSSRLDYLENLHVAPGTEIPTVNLFFDSDSYRLSLAEKQKIVEIINFLKKYPVFALRLKAYADTMGNKNRNIELAKQRNESVLSTLRQHGLPDSTIISIANGEISGPDEIKNVYNRRVEITPYVHGRYASTAQNNH